MRGRIPDIIHCTLAGLRRSFECGAIKRDDVKNFLMLSAEENESKQVVMTRTSIGFYDLETDKAKGGRQ